MTRRTWRGKISLTNERGGSAVMTYAKIVALILVVWADVMVWSAVLG